VIVLMARIANVCLYCENQIVGAADPDAGRTVEGGVCKVHLRGIFGGPHDQWPRLHPDGWCDWGGRCRPPDQEQLERMWEAGKDHEDAA
jgi:hypothetical protein